MGNTTNGESYERISMKIFVITAPSSAGKDSIVNKLKHKYHVPTSFTTRPKRDYEVDGKDYHFITKEEFYFKFNNNEILEHREYNTLLNGKPDTWYYGLSYDEIFKCYNNIGNYAVILDVQGMRTIKEYINRTFKDSIEVITIMLQASYYTRLSRYLNRDKVTDDMVKEAIRRINADMNEIEPFINEYDIVLRSENNDLERNVKIIKSLCE